MDMEEFDRSTANLSMREKSVLKRRINREHNSNFRAGYISINENYLQKTGLRGRKRYFLYCVLVILILVALLNVLFTAGIIYLLRFSGFGLGSIEFINQNKLVRFLVDSKFSSVGIAAGELGSRSGSPLQFKSDGGSIQFKTLYPEESGLSFNSEETVIDTVDDFRIVNARNGQPLLSTNSPVFYRTNSKKNIQASSLEASKIENLQMFEDLYIETNNNLTLTGLKGIHITSDKTPIDFHSGNTISVLSKDGNLILDTEKGLFLDTSIPVTRATLINPGSGILAYTICVCLSANQDVGSLFMLEVTQAGVHCGSVKPDAVICPS